MHTIVWLGNLKGRDHSEDRSIDERITLDWILGKLGGKAWTGCLAQDRDHWLALVNTV